MCYSMDIILPNEIGRRYDKIADIFEQERSLTVGLDYVQRFLYLLALKTKKLDSYTILDIGCGTGIPITRKLVLSGAKVIGLDISTEMIAKARINVPNAFLIKGDILTSKIERKFDGIFAWDSLFHIPVDRQEKIIREVIGLLNTNGVFLFTTGGKYGELVCGMFGEKFYYSSLSNDQYKNILVKENCQVIINEKDDSSSHGHRVICCRKKR